MGKSNIDALLDSYHANTLIEMAREAGLSIKDKHGKRIRKGVLLNNMKKHYFTEARVRASWEKLSENERAIVNRLLLHNDATASTSIFRQEVVRAGLADMPPDTQRRSRHYRSDAPYAPTGAYIGNPFRTNSSIFEDIIARLTLHGIVFSKSTTYRDYAGEPYKLQFHPHLVIFIPKEVRRHLPPPYQIPPPLSGWKPSRIEEGNPESLLRNLYLYWDFVRRHPVTYIKSGYIGKRWLKAINKTLITPDPLLQQADHEGHTAFLHLLRSLLMRCDLLKWNNEYLSPTNDDPLHVPDFWKLSRFEQRIRLLQAWTTAGAITGVLQGIGNYEISPDHARQVIHEILLDLPTDTWLDIAADVMPAIREHDGDFLFPSRSDIEQHPARSYYGYYYYREYPQQILDKFDHYEEAFVTYCFSGFLHQIGLIELGYDEDGNLKGIRLPKSAQSLLTDEPIEEPSADEGGGKLILQPNFQLMALGPVDFSLLAIIDLFARRERVDVSAFEYHISRQSVYQAQQMGMETSAVIRFLERHCEAGIPQNVRRSLDEWDAHHKRIVFRSGVALLQTADAELLRALLDDPDIGPHLARHPTTDTITLARSKHEKSLVTALVKKGFFPNISDANPRSADHSVTIDTDGHIRTIHVTPSIYLMRRLSGLAEPLAPGEWQLTPTSIGQAGGSREKVTRILEELEALNRGPLPEQVVERVKAWGGYYGRARAATVTLIEFHSRAAMEELLVHPALKPYLTPFPTKDRALVTVPTEKLEQIKEILTERFGIPVAEGLRRRRRR